MVHHRFKFKRKKINFFKYRSNWTSSLNLCVKNRFKLGWRCVNL